MGKWRKKPIIIEVEQFFADKHPWPSGVYSDGENFKNVSGKAVRYYAIDTLEGKHDVIDGDWIATGVKGERYPIKPDIFEMTYESVEEESKDIVKKVDKEDCRIYSRIRKERKEVKNMNDQLEQQMQDLRTKKASGTALTPEEQAVLDALLALDEDQEDVDAATTAVATAQAAVNTSAQQALDNAKADLDTKQKALDSDMSAYQSAQSALDATNAPAGGTTPANDGGTTTTP